MKTEKFYFVLAVVTAILCTPALGEVELPRHEATLLAPPHPVLVGIKKLYVIVEPSDAKPGKDGLVWEELQKKVENKLKEAGIEIAPGIHLGQGFRAHDIPELRVYMEMLKFADSQVYVFRTQVSLATMVYLKEQKVFFKADAWQAGPTMQAVSVEDMPARVTHSVLEQVEAFVHAYLAANPQDEQPSDANDTCPVSLTAQKQQSKPPAKQTVAKYKYVASKNSKVFHKPECSSAKRISPTNLVSYNSRDEALKAGKRPCKICKP